MPSYLLLHGGAAFSPCDDDRSDSLNDTAPQSESRAIGLFLPFNFAPHTADLTRSSLTADVSCACLLFTHAAWRSSYSNPPKAYPGSAQLSAAAAAASGRSFYIASRLFFSKPDSHTDHCLTNLRPLNDFGMLTAIHVIFLAETRRYTCASTLPRHVALQQQPQRSARDTRESRIASQKCRFHKDRMARIGRDGRETNIRPVAQLTGLLGLPERQKGIPETKACVRGSKQTKRFPGSRARTWSVAWSKLNLRCELP